MKNVKVSLTAFVISLSFLFTQCSPEQVSTPSTENLLIASPWKVHHFYQSQDLTSHFGNVKLLFSNTGTVAVQKGNETVYGSWNRTFDSHAEMIHIHFNSADPTVEMLRQSWKLVEKTNHSFRFEMTDPTITTLGISKQ